MVCEQGERDMCDEIFQCQKYRLGFLEERLRPELEVNGNELEKSISG